MAGWKRKAAAKRVRNACTLALLAALCIAPARAVPAEPAPASTPVAEAAANEARPLPERARAVLDVRCAECREAYAGDGILDMAALAEDPRFVVPKEPDASRIYQRLLTAQSGSPGDGGSAPAPADVEVVRDWIDSLPARRQACHGRAGVMPAAVDALIGRWVEKIGVVEAADTRFVSLVHLWNSCANPQRLAEARETAATLLAGLARHRGPLEIETLGEESAILAVRLSQIAVLPAEWARLTAPAPRTAGTDAVAADWLAARILSIPKDASGAVDPAFDVAFDAVGQRAVRNLARTWERSVDLVRAAAERGVTPRALAATLAGVGGDFLLPARRLLYGAISRAAWESLSHALDGAAKPGSAVKDPPSSGAEIDVLLWADQPFYRPRDLVTIHASVGKACYLTLIDVDQDGKATVLFPNELEPDNLVAPGVNISLPGRDAGYQFRFERSGEEKIIAICQRKSRRPAGISYDYERQRFAFLDDWRTFLRTAPEREAKTRESSDTSRRRRERTPANAQPLIGADDPLPMEGRAAISITIDPGGGPAPD